MDHPQLMTRSTLAFDFMKNLLIVNNIFANLQYLHQEVIEHDNNHLILRCIREIIYLNGKRS